MSRIVALCRGGPLDGQVFSVEEGEPLTSRQEIVGVLYAPTDEAITDDISKWDDEFEWHDHEKVVIYACG